MNEVGTKKTNSINLLEIFKSYDDINRIKEEDIHEKVVSLLKEGADPNETQPVTRKTVLHQATLKNHTKVMKTLLEWRADPNSKESFSGNTPLFYTNSAKAVALLAEYKADLNHLNRYGSRPIDHACSIMGLKATDIFIRMLSCGATLDRKAFQSAKFHIESLCHPDWNPKDSPAQQQRKKMLQILVMRIFMDVNWTAIPADPARGRSVEQALQSALAEIFKGVWTWNSGFVSYSDFIAQKFTDSDERFEKTSHFVEWLENWKSPINGKPYPKREQVLKIYHKVCKIMEGRYFVPAFTTLIRLCQFQEIPIRIIFRTFGKDLDAVIEEYNKLFPERKITERGKFEGHTLKVGSQTYKTAKDIHQFFLELDGDIAIQDSYPAWKESKRSSIGGKIFPVDGNSHFFDDNCTGRKKDDIIYPVDPISETETYFPTEMAHRVNLIKAILDPLYFFKFIFGEKYRSSLI